MSDDERVDRELRALPRVEPSAQFTERVLARLQAARRPRTWTVRLLPLAGVAAAVLAIPAARCLYAPAEAELRARRYEELRRESIRLAAEIEQLRQLARARRPVIYLGGTDQVDLVLDVGRLHRTAARMRPVSTNPGGSEEP